jgi:hypothetical protein
MGLTDYLGIVVFGGFGRWWIIFPRSVAHFYSRFHAGRIQIPKPAAIRVIGCAWVALVLTVVLTVQRSFTIPPAPRPLTTSETSDDLTWRFHKQISEAERQHILDGPFTTVTSTELMPPPVKRAFATITGERFALASAGEKYQVTDVISEPGLPFRRLVFAGSTADRWFIHYERGGRGVSFAVVVFGMSADGTLSFLWGGSGFERAQDLPQLRQMVAAGRFTDCASCSW